MSILNNPRPTTRLGPSSQIIVPNDKMLYSKEIGASNEILYNILVSTILVGYSSMIYYTVNIVRS